MPPRRPPTVEAWRGIVYRATSYDVPLWSRPNRRGGRWNIAGQGATQYFCSSAEACFAETLRHEDLRREEEAAGYRTEIWQIRVEEGSIADYSTFEQAEAAGFPPDALVDDDHERCQAEAQWLKSHAVRGVISPSAALPDHLNITLFGPRVAVSWNASVRLASTLPVQKLAAGGPPAGMTGRVRYFGQPHPSLESYLAAKRAERSQERDVPPS